MFTAAFLICTQLFVCDVYVDNVYNSHEACQTEGNKAYIQLQAGVEADQFLIGDCVESQDPLSKEEVKTFLEKKLLNKETQPAEKS